MRTAIRIEALNFLATVLAENALSHEASHSTIDWVLRVANSPTHPLPPPPLPPHPLPPSSIPQDELMEGVVLPLLQPVAEDPDPDVRCRAVQLLTHLVTEASPTWAAQSLAIISSVSVCVCACKHACVCV